MSVFHPLPKSMPFRARAEMMVKRGEARDFGTACKMLRKPPAQSEPAPVNPTPRRLPYKDE